MASIMGKNVLIQHSLRWLSYFHGWSTERLRTGDKASNHACGALNLVSSYARSQLLFALPSSLTSSSYKVSPFFPFKGCPRAPIFTIFDIAVKGGLSKVASKLNFLNSCLSFGTVGPRRFWASLV
jgi:hypothetical protein